MCSRVFNFMYLSNIITKILFVEREIRENVTRTMMLHVVSYYASNLFDVENVSAIT